jgi:hypothetical protein
MGIYLYIATAIGLFIATQTNGQWHIAKHTLKEHSLTSIAATGGVILAGTRDGIQRKTVSCLDLCLTKICKSPIKI